MADEDLSLKEHIRKLITGVSPVEEDLKPFPRGVGAASELDEPIFSSAEFIKGRDPIESLGIPGRAPENRLTKGSEDTIEFFRELQDSLIPEKDKELHRSIESLGKRLSEMTDEELEARGRVDSKFMKRTIDFPVDPDSDKDVQLMRRIIFDNDAELEGLMEESIERALTFRESKAGDISRDIEGAIRDFDGPGGRGLTPKKLREIATDVVSNTNAKELRKLLKKVPIIGVLAGMVGALDSGDASAAIPVLSEAEDIGVGGELEPARRFVEEPTGNVLLDRINKAKAIEAQKIFDQRTK